MIETVITSSVLILIIIILRTVFKGRIKSTVRYALWLIAAVRLMLPFSLIESSVSIMNLVNGFLTTEIQQEDNTYIPDITAAVSDAADSASASGGAPADKIFSGQMQQEQPPFKTSADSRYYGTYNEHPSAETNSTMYYQNTPAISEIPENTPEKKTVPLKTTAIIIWIIGASIMLFWFGAVNVIFYAGLRRTRKAFDYDAPLKIYSVQGINSPCIFGFPKPAIYLPEKAACENESIRFVVTHELCHYYHGDMIWVFLRYILLALYWFDPLVWAAAILSKRDCECACDEAAIHRVGEGCRFEYGKAVIDLIPQKQGEMFGIVSTSMASSKNVLKERMTMIAAKPKNRRFALVFSALAVIFAAFGTFTSAVNNEDIYADEVPPESEETAVPTSLTEDAFNISETDYTGTDRTLYYAASPDDSPEEDRSLNKITDDLWNGDTIPEPEIMKYESFQADLFDHKLAERFGVTGEIPQGYIMAQTGNILLGVPYDGNLNTLDSLLLWQTKDMNLRITQNGMKAPDEGVYSETGSFGGRDCIYYEDTAKNEMGLIFSDYDGNNYTASFEYKSEDDISTGLKIFGSIHLAEKPAEPVYVSSIQLSSEPSIYGDENYDIADTDTWWYEGTFRANAPALLETGFQITNGVTDYETNFECWIEKYEPDGNWYRVIPIADIVQVNTGFGHFYTTEEEGRIPCCIDLSCYPLLPVGKYRLVKPFRLKGSDHDEYAALFDFYMSDRIEPEGELLCTAECLNKEISSDTKTITYEIKSSKVGFALSEVIDMERETPDGWKSVRTGAIRTNSLHASFPLGFAGTYTLDTSDFDISVSGNYRIRLSYGNRGVGLEVPRNGYDTAYAYFKVK